VLKSGDFVHRLASLARTSSFAVFVLMKRNLVLLVLLLFVSTACQPSESQPVDDMDRAERARIVENLKYQIPQLRQAQTIELSALKSASVPGFRRATLTVNGANPVPVLIREDGEQALVLATDPIDVSQSAEEAKAAVEEESSAQREEFASMVSSMPARGPSDAPVTLAVFSDFQCPYCAQSLGLINELQSRYPDELKFVFLHFPLPMHGWAKPASVAAHCAARQSDDAFWALHDAYFDRQGQITEANVIRTSEEVLSGTSVNLDEWRTCAAEDGSEIHQQVVRTVETHVETGQQLQVRGTPTFFINGEIVRGARTVDAFAQRIETAME